MTMTTLQNIPDVRFADEATWATHGAEWPSGETRRIECCAVRNETHDVKTFVFRCADFTALAFEPGQFITISPQIDGKILSRCYTLSSSPTRPFNFCITVKRVPGGEVSNWLHDNLHPGSTLAASGPAGSFTPVGLPTGKQLYLSAGSGITPLMAMARAAYDLAANLDIVFMHSARSPADIIFRDELAQMQAHQSRFRVLAVCEAKGEETDWHGPIGRLDLALLTAQVPDFLEREVFTCGPQGYMSATRGVLENAGFNLAHYHQESFDINALAAETVVPAAPASAPSETSFTVTLAKSGKTFSVSPNQTLLAAAKKAGAVVPSSCSQGVCGTCKTAVLQGDVDMQHNGGIRQREIDKGLRLLCCSRPTSDLVLDL